MQTGGQHPNGAGDSCPYTLELRIRVAHLLQIRRARLGIELLEQRVVARVGFRLHDPAGLISEVAELDGRRRARLLARRLDVTITQLPARQLRIDLRPVDPL